jgi:multidrug resistance efflux pump
VLCFLLRINFYVSAEGIIEPLDQVLVKAQADGVIGEIFVKEGEKVEKGDPILRLDSLEIESDKKAILAEYSQAEYVYLSFKELWDKGIISRKEFQDSERDFKIASSKKEKLEQFLIVAPRSGFVISGKELSLRKGDFLKKGDLVAKITDLDRFIARTYIPEDKISKIRVNQKATVEIKGFSHFKGVFRGKVIKILPEGVVSDEKRQFEVNISLEESLFHNERTENLKIYPLIGAKIKIVYLYDTFLQFLIKEKIGW